MSEESLPPDSPADAAAIARSREGILDALDDGCCLLDDDSRITYANLAFARLIGLPRVQLIGKTCAEACDGNCRSDQIATLLSRENLSPDGVRKEVDGIVPGQRLRVRITPLWQELSRETIYLVTVVEVNDISAREREIARVEQRARFGELAAGLAHEIKNPLAGIQGAVDILLSQRALRAAERDVLEGVRREVGRIDKTIQMLLDRARPRVLSVRLASISQAVERAVNLAQATLSAAGRDHVRIEIDAPSDPIEMQIDAVQIEDAILNLLLNAINAIDGMGTIKVRVYETAAEDREVVIDVADDGRGIAADDLSRIFSPFYTTDPAGTGLGLSAVRGIARAHGGKVDVSSKVGDGSTFSFRLPRHRLDRSPLVSH